MVQQDLKIWIILIHITDARRGGYMIRERVRKAELAGRSRRVGRRKRTLIRRLAPSLNLRRRPETNIG
jgi:hypothetical protein